MFHEQFFEDYAIGDTRRTLGRTITEADIVLHAGQTGDFFPHHMDAEWCKTQDFGQRIAHGTLIFSVAIGMTAGAINVRAMSYGYDRLRFIRPVFIGDTIRVSATIADKRDHPKRAESGIVAEKIEVVNQHDQTVLVCEHLYLVQRRGEWRTPMTTIAPLELNYRPRLPPKTDYGIGIVGCGGIVNYAHLPAYAANGLRVLACYDLNGEAARKTAADHGIPTVYESLDALLADEQIAIVDIAVPAWHQRAIAEQALAAGKHLLCQKPLAEELPDAQAIADAARRSGRKAAVNQQMRWSAGIAAAKDLVARGAIGQPTDAQIQVSVTTPWHMWPWLKVAPRLEIMYHSIHYLDSLRYLFGDPAWVTSRHARYPSQPETGETKTVTVLDYDSGMQALVAVNHHDHSDDSYATFRFLGTEGLIKGTIGLLYNYPHGRPDTLQVHSKRVAPDTWFDIKLEGLWIPDAFIGPMASLMDAIQSDGTPITDVADNLGTLRVVHAAYRSAAEHRSIRQADLLPA